LYGVFRFKPSSIVVISVGCALNRYKGVRYRQPIKRRLQAMVIRTNGIPHIDKGLVLFQSIREGYHGNTAVKKKEEEEGQ
jgi:hypothetical protein